MIAYENSISFVVIYISICVFIYTLSLSLRGKRSVYPHKGKVKKKRNKFSSETLNVLFVIAHPDDECMFFGPSMVNHCNDFNTQVSLLCLSTGDFYGEGDRRKKELIKSCKVFGIPQKKVFVVDHSQIQDDPTVYWNSKLVGDEIMKVVKKMQIGKIVTFDCSGASRHKNHISVYRAVRQLVIDQRFPKGTRTYSLETVFFLRHYISFLDLPFSILTVALRGSRLLLSSPKDIWTAQRAMKAHWSQFVWFRILEIMFSRYLVVNTLKPINRSSPT